MILFVRRKPTALPLSKPKKAPRVISGRISVDNLLSIPATQVSTLRR